jgi:Family of unknown function (DUF6516)
MNALLLLRERIVLSEKAFVELVVWQLPKPLPGSAHRFKYRLALVAEGRRILRYDNESGKGDHKHIGEVEAAYTFDDMEQLQADFWSDIETWSKRT